MVAYPPRGKTMLGPHPVADLLIGTPNEKIPIAVDGRAFFLQLIHDLLA